jgi:outer membrane protein insertion porin family
MRQFGSTQFTRTGNHHGPTTALRYQNMPAIVVLAFFCPAQLCAEGLFEPAVSKPPIIRSVAIRGTRLPVDLATQVGQPCNAAVIEKDVRRLWDMGRFEDIRVETERQDDGTAVIFRVVQAPTLLLHKLAIEPSNLGVRLMLPEGAPVDRRRAQAMAEEARKQLNAQGYTNAQVDSKLVRVAARQADLHIAITPGDRIRVTEIQFAGDSALESKELHQALRALRIRRILGWPLFPAYSPEAVEADLARLRSLYLSKGYFDAKVRLDGIDIHDKSAAVSIRVEAGPLYRVKDRRPCDICASLLRARREAEREGVLDFSATLKVQREGDPANPVADLETTIARGSAYRLGRIEFTGNHHYSDAMLRRNFLLDEGRLLDGRLLRKSIRRLNEAMLFEPIDESQVVIHPSETGRVADVIVRLTERKRGAWRLSGPVGPASFAGPLEASLSSRLPPWGSGLFELATYTASVSMYAFAHPILPLLAVNSRRRFLPVLALARPFTPGEGWKSGFSVAPQLGWRWSALNYASTQVEQRLLPVLSGDRGLVPDLQVTVEDPSGEGVLFCEPPPPRFAKLRYVATIGVRLMKTFSGVN